MFRPKPATEESTFALLAYVQAMYREQRSKLQKLLNKYSKSIKNLPLSGRFFLFSPYSLL